MYFLFLLFAIFSQHLLAMDKLNTPSKSSNAKNLAIAPHVSQNTQKSLLLDLPQELKEKIFFDFLYDGEHKKRTQDLAKIFARFPSFSLENYEQSIGFVNVHLNSSKFVLKENYYCLSNQSQNLFIIPIIKDIHVAQKIHASPDIICNRKQLGSLKRVSDILLYCQKSNIQYHYRQTCTLNNFWNNQSIYQWFFLPAFLWINTLDLFEYSKIKYTDESIVKDNQNKEILNAWLTSQFEKTRDVFWQKQQVSLKSPLKQEYVPMTLPILAYNLFVPFFLAQYAF